MSDATILEDYQGLLQSKKLPQGQKKALLAAIELFAKQGFDGTSTAQIAERAGISQATIFKYFKTKADLLNAVIGPVAHDLFPKIQEDFIQEIKQNSVKSRQELVHFIVFNRFAFIKKNRQVIKIMLQEALTNPDFVSEIREASKKRLAENPRLVASVKSILLEKHPEYEALDLIRLISAPIAAYFVQRFVLLPEKAADEDRDLNLIVDQILDALK
ncbi:TetR family transcriptional regulator [Lactobacillus nasalidis]|uniref:TetR family transcriptional regulator n=1 Tax=Lactobacillus nasalidis TaxID=2797258 RepID=A0ABQ3W4B3_9LACO|nr:TetR/AcrR family transcriptional regulator [Lactobacillus nasalidis]GHV96909.1 TetR family transcriptional regulator [Lactobacillus nasalidis]GHV98850.1 TetR family transcriptional regulator [Lactobacillus nasalidis]GHW01353.1 TetR family transcriptional regulator [Lactobacillus nasalidis]